MAHETLSDREREFWVAQERFRAKSCFDEWHPRLDVDCKAVPTKPFQQGWHCPRINIVV